MKYADGPQTQVDVLVDAPPPRVWSLASDIEVPVRFSPELQRVEWLDGAAGPAIGSSFAGYNHNTMLNDWRTVSHVVEYEPPRVFGYAVVDADGTFGDPEPPDPRRPVARWTFTVEPLDGGSLLRQSVRLGPARSGVSLVIDQMPDREDDVVAFRLRELRTAMQATVEGVKALAERRE